MDIFLVNEDNEHAKSLCEKLSATAANGIAMLNTDEMLLYRHEDFQHLTFGNEGNSNIVEVQEGKSYIFICDQNTNIDDVSQTWDVLNIRGSIIRVDKPSVKEKLRVM